jgi:cytochrome c oxidase cbb3-type subunit 4
MDIGTLQAIGTVLAFVAFIGICLWAYSGKRKQGFIEAANLPFADENVANTQAVQRQKQSPSQREHQP